MKTDDPDELWTETLTIRLTPTEKQKIEAAGKVRFNVELPIATVAREILMSAVEKILKRKLRS